MLPSWSTGRKKGVRMESGKRYPSKHAPRDLLPPTSLSSLLPIIPSNYKSINRLAYWWSYNPHGAIVLHKLENKPSIFEFFCRSFNIQLIALFSRSPVIISYGNKHLAHLQNVFKVSTIPVVL
jgi:hypothetical protein